jgi:hypothetical protein
VLAQPDTQLAIRDIAGVNIGLSRLQQAAPAPEVVAPALQSASRLPVTQPAKARVVAAALQDTLNQADLNDVGSVEITFRQALTAQAGRQGVDFSPVEVAGITQGMTTKDTLTQVREAVSVEQNLASVRQLDQDTRISNYNAAIDADPMIASFDKPEVKRLARAFSNAVGQSGTTSANVRQALVNEGVESGMAASMSNPVFLARVAGRPVEVDLNEARALAPSRRIIAGTLQNTGVLPDTAGPQTIMWWPVWSASIWTIRHCGRRRNCAMPLWRI